MVTGTWLILSVIVLVIIVFGTRAMWSYWQQETNLSDEDNAFDRRVAAHNDQLAHQRRDDDIVRILRGREMPTIVDQYPDDD